MTGRTRGRHSWARAGRTRGVTLIELMVVIVIIGILAAIAYPSYQAQVQQTRRADGKSELLETAQLLERCFTRYNSYADPDCKVAEDLGDGGIESPEGWYMITDADAGASTFELVAAPRDAQTADARCGDLSLTHLGERGATGSSGPETCW